MQGVVSRPYPLPPSEPASASNGTSPPFPSSQSCPRSETTGCSRLPSPVRTDCSGHLCRGSADRVVQTKAKGPSCGPDAKWPGAQLRALQTWESMLSKLRRRFLDPTGLVLQQPRLAYNLLCAWATQCLPRSENCAVSYRYPGSRAELAARLAPWAYYNGRWLGSGNSSHA